MDEPKTVNVFIDEYGTPSLHTDKAGTTKYFIYAAVVIPESQIETARRIHSEIVKQDCPAGYIKSSKITNNSSALGKYLGMLTRLKNLEHYVIALIVDKEQIKTDSGLSFKPIFIKYFQRILSQTLTDCYSEIHIISDKTGDINFQQSLKTYMEDKAGLEPTLFSNNTFNTADDITEEPLLQLADLYVGVLGKYYCGKFDDNHAQVIHDTIKSRISIEWFPEESIPMFAIASSFNSTFDKELFDLSVNSAKKYLELNQQDKVGCELIQYLIQEGFRKPTRHISSKEIKEYLTARKIEIGDPIVKVSELRDKGVIIISPIGKKGYKFPTSEQEIAEFLNRLSSNIVPQLKRGYIINDVLAKQSYGKYNVLKSSEFDLLNRLSEIVNKG
jgi:hypothetical protein